MTDSDVNDLTDSDEDFTAEGAAQSDSDADPWAGVGVRQRADKDEDTSTEAPDSSLNPDDAGADADLPRPSRAEKQRYRRRTHVSTAIPALLLIGIGGLALAKPEILTPPLFAGALAVTALLAVLLRFLFNARRERGLFFISLVIVFVVTLFVLNATQLIDLSQMWPLLLGAPGLAILLTYMFERSHERGLLLPGFMLMVASVALLPFTTGTLDRSLLNTVALYWPILFILIALALLPRAIRDRAE